MKTSQKMAQSFENWAKKIAKTSKRGEILKNAGRKKLGEIEKNGVGKYEKLKKKKLVTTHFLKSFRKIVEISIAVKFS